MTEGLNVSKRELILQAALEVFSVRGFHSARMEEIAQEAGVGKGTVYEYFKSKEHLFKETLKEGFSLYNSQVRQELGREVTAAGKLTGLIRNNFKFGRRFCSLARIAMLETIPIDGEFRSSLQEMHLECLKMIDGIIGEGIERGEFRRLNRPVFTRLFYGGMSFTFSPFTDLEMNENEIDKYAAETIEYYLKGIGS